MTVIGSSSGGTVERVIRLSSFGTVNGWNFCPAFCQGRTGFHLHICSPGTFCLIRIWMYSDANVFVRRAMIGMWRFFIARRLNVQGCAVAYDVEKCETTTRHLWLGKVRVSLSSTKSSCLLCSHSVLTSRAATESFILLLHRIFSRPSLCIL